MKKQELIKHFEDMPYVSVSQMGKKSFVDLIKQLDEPQKVTVPQFVADWIEYCKTKGIALGYALYCSGQASDKKAYDWIVESFENQETFALAWINGYTVEKEKRYTVKMRSTKQPLFYNNMYEKIFFSMGDLATQFTRKQLEEAGLGWVFDCPGIEVEEV